MKGMNKLHTNHKGMKKAIFLATLFLLCAILTGCGGFPGSTEDKIPISPELTLSMLKKYLPQGATDPLSDFKEYYTAGEKTRYVWTDPVTSNFIEVLYADDGMDFFTYQLHFGEQPIGERISKTQAAKLAQDFAADFVRGGDTLAFANKPDATEECVPGEAEGWTASKAGREVVVVVNLQHGYVQSFLVNGE